MNSSLRSLKDAELLSSVKVLAQKERALTLEVLHHLQEIERRKLYATPELRYGSLFDYAVHELKYSHGAADRRIKAMRLLKEMPEIESKIESGALSLTNISHAQNFFRDLKNTLPDQAMTKEEKIEVLAQLEDKSSREGQRLIFSISPPQVLPRERERMVSEEHTQVTFLINQQLKDSLDEVRALLGPKGTHLSLAELVAEMANLSRERLNEKRFGKKRARQLRDAAEIDEARPRDDTESLPPTIHSPATQRIQSGAGLESRVRTRYIPRAVKHEVWRKAGGKCTSCGLQHKLQYDHVKPFALGGDSSPENIQLLCGSCNLRRGVATFGAQTMKRV